MVRLVWSCHQWWRCRPFAVDAARMLCLKERGLRLEEHSSQASVLRRWRESMNDRVQEGWIGSGGDLVLMSETADEGSHQELDQPTKPHGTGDESHGAERWQPARSFWQPRFCQDSAL